MNKEEITTDDVLKRKPIVVELYADNGQLCGHELRDANTGEIICSEDDEWLNKHASQYKADLTEWNSENIIGRVKERHKELKSKGWDYTAFYNGWLEGRVDMLRTNTSEVERLKEENASIKTDRDAYKEMWTCHSYTVNNQKAEIGELKSKIHSLESQLSSEKDKAVEWISINDRSPECEQLVLACFENGAINTIQYINHEEGFDPYADPLHIQVMYWMPLPQPPIQKSSKNI